MIENTINVKCDKCKNIGTLSIGGLTKKDEIKELLPGCMCGGIYQIIKRGKIKVVNNKRIN